MYESSHPYHYQIASTVKLINTMSTADVTSMNAACGALTADQISVQLGNGPISPPPLNDMQSAMTAPRVGMEFRQSSVPNLFCILQAYLSQHHILNLHMCGVQDVALSTIVGAGKATQPERCLLAETAQLLPA